jgi:hypothetical protein
LNIAVLHLWPKPFKQRRGVGDGSNFDDTERFSRCASFSLRLLDQLAEAI